MTKSVRSPGASAARLTGGTALILLVTISGLGIYLWWEDRPLRKIEQALARRDFDQALRLANSYLEAFPNRSEALIQKARALAGLSRWSEASRLFDAVGTDSIAGQRAWVQALLHEERWSEALPLLIRLGNLSPDDPDLLHELAACEFKLGYFDEAVRIAERLSQLDGSELRGRLLLGMLEFRRMNNRLAIQAWEPILERNPDLTGLQLTPAEFLRLYGQALLEYGRPADARPVLVRSVQMAATPEAQADGQNALAEVYEQLDDLPEAVALWRQIVAANPDDRKARAGLARAALEEKSVNEALAWLQPLLSRDDLLSSTAFLAQRAATLAGDETATAAWKKKADLLRKRERRIRVLDQRMRDSPHSFWARALQAHRFAREGNAHQALVMAEGLLREDSEQAFVKQLVDALRNHKPLPDLDLVPVDRF